jgi:hypothetical protein
VEEGIHVVVLDLASGESRDLTPGEGVVAAIEKLSTEHVDEVLGMAGKLPRATESCGPRRRPGPRCVSVRWTAPESAA